MTDTDWKQLLLLGEQLANQATPEAQCEVITRVAAELLSTQARLWLASPAYPLPGNSGVETLPEEPADALAHLAFLEKKIVYASPDPEAPGQVYHSTKETSGAVSLAIPLSSKAKLLGVMQLDRDLGRPFSEQEIHLAEGIALHAANAMEITRQEAIKNWYFEQLNLVRSVATKIASLSQLDDLYAQVTRLICETFKFNYVAIFILDGQSHTLIFKGSASQDLSNPLETGFTVKLGEGIIGRVGESGTEIISPDVRQDLRYRHLEALANTHSEAALPLIIENRILGVLDIQSEQVDAFQDNDLLVVRALADNLALAIESKYLTFGLERRAEQISSIFEISHAITSILDLEELSKAIVRLIKNRFLFPFVHIYTVHLGRRLAIYQTGVDKNGVDIHFEGQHFPLDTQQGVIAWVARNGKSFLTKDIAREELHQPTPLTPDDIRSELAIPLIHGKDVLGVLDIQSCEYNGFDEHDQALFEALAAPIAVAMHNAILYRSEQWRRKVAESFKDVAQLVSASLPLDQLLQVILEKLENNLPCDGSAIWLLDEEVDPATAQKSLRLRLAATRNIDPEKIASALQERSAQEMLERTINTEQPLIRRIDDPLGPLGIALDFGPNYSSIAAPMRTNDRSLGVITLAHNQEGRYGSESQAITATFASYAAVAIQNVRFNQETQEQALISTMLLQVAEASQTTMTIEDLLATMVRLTRLLVGVRKCAFLLWEDDKQSFRLNSWYGFEPVGETTRLFSARSTGFLQLAHERKVLYLEDPERELDFPELEISNGIIVMLPLLVRGEIIGAFLVGLHLTRSTSAETGFDPKALAILQGIAHQTSITIDNLRLLEARQEEAYVTAALLQVAQAVVSSTDLNDTLDTIVHLLPILVGIDTCVIFLWDSLKQLFRPTQAYAENRREEEAILSRPFSPGENLLLDAVRQKGEMLLSELPIPNLPISEWASLPCQSFDQINLQARRPANGWVLGYPLSLQEQVFGVLVVCETNVTQAFWERRMEILNGIAQQISLAIQNDVYKQEMVQTERIEREIQLARQIQETFLPDELPALNRWELDLRWETAREVGGDFYDIFKLGENRVGLVIADVSDKGIPAALYMTVARTLIRANAAGGQKPAEVLEEVNKLLLNDSNDAMFITAIYTILDLNTGELAYANAGHNLPLLYRSKNKDLEQLPKGGTALGVLENLKLENHYMIIQPGEALILYTDGVTDALAPDGKFFGEDRLQALIRDHGGEPVHEMLEYLDDALIEFRRGLAPIDDITLVAIRREPAQVKAPRKRKLPLVQKGQ